MDPCRDLRRKLITALQEQKTRTLREAQEGASLLQEATRHALAGTAEQAAYGRWLRYQREVLFPAHQQAQKIDLQILESMQAPCHEIRKKARELGIGDLGAPGEGAEEHPPMDLPAEQGRPPLAAPPIPSDTPEEEETEEEEVAHLAEAPDVTIEEVAALAPKMPEEEETAEEVAYLAEVPDVTIEEAPPLPPDMPEEEEAEDDEVAYLPEVPDVTIEEAPPLPPDMLKQEEEEADEVADLAEAPDVTIEEAPPLLPEMLEEKEEEEAEEDEVAYLAEAPDVTIEEAPPLLPEMLEQKEEEEAEKDEVADLAEVPDVMIEEAPPLPPEVPEPDIPRPVPEHAEPRGAIWALKDYYERWSRRPRPVWLVPLLASLAGIAVVSVVVILLLNRAPGWRISKTTPTSAPQMASATPVEAAPIAALTNTPVPPTPSPPAETDTPIPPTATPVPQPTSTTAPSPTVVVQPTSTTAPSPTPTPAATPTPVPTPTPATPQILVDGTYNVRTGPGTSYARAGQVRAGETLDIVARNSDGTWWQVCCVDGEEVWIKADLAPTQGPTGAVAVAADIPPTPTPAPPTAAPTATPTVVEGVPAELPGKIAFPVFDPGHRTYDLYVASPDGSDMGRVLDEASQPALSPDGQHIAFRYWWSGGRGITVMNTYGGDLRKFSNFHEDALPSWSPDGQTLVFFSRRESDRKSRIYQVWLADRTEWEMARGGGSVYGEYPTWMADGSIVYRATWPELGIAVMKTDGSGDRLLFSDQSATAPAASPDGAYITFMSLHDGNWEIYRINTDGSGLVRLTDNEANDGLPAWSPDGNTIAFVSDRDGAWGMWAMTADGQGHTLLFELPGSPNGLIPDEPEYTTKGWLEERISWGP